MDKNRKSVEKRKDKKKEEIGSEKTKRARKFLSKGILDESASEGEEREVDDGGDVGDCHVGDDSFLDIDDGRDEGRWVRLWNKKKQDISTKRNERRLPRV